MARQPAIFLPHGGGPCFFMDWTMGPPSTWDRLGAWLRALPALLPCSPTALVVVSAHWEESVATVTSGAHPPLVYDYYGFPAHTYELQWPAPGDPALAEELIGRLREYGIPARGDPDRGFDHGVFVPLKVAYPEPTVPVVQLSLLSSLDPGAHFALGRALEPLRDDGVVVLGSGMSFHNMSLFGSGSARPVSRTFDRWLLSAATAEHHERLEQLSRWEHAPEARSAHPREEHLAPLFVVASAAGTDSGTCLFADEPMNAAISAIGYGTPRPGEAIGTTDDPLGGAKGSRAV